MTVFRFATCVQQVNPVRVQQWNASIRAGDDFKLALTVYGEDGTATDVSYARSRLMLVPASHMAWGSWDYGLSWQTACYGPPVQVDGYFVEGQTGRLNFFLPASTTTDMCGRYRLLVQIDMVDGVFTEVEGVIQVRAGLGAGLGHVAGGIFQLDGSPLDGPFVLADGVRADGTPVDADGFPLGPTPPVGGSGALNAGILGQTVLTA